MKYIVIVILLIVSVYPLSYAKYNWKNKNRFGAVGSILLAAMAVVYPVILLLRR